MIGVLLAATAGLVVGVGLNPLATRLKGVPRARREAVTAVDEEQDDGLYFRFRWRSAILPVVNGLLYGALWWHAGASSLVAGLLTTFYSTIFLLVAIVDLETRLIPNVLILPAIGVAAVSSTIDPRLTWKSALVGGAVGFLLFYVIALLARGGFGAGDVKLAAFIGLVAGFPGVLTGLIVGIIVGGVAAVLLLLTGRASRKTYIPYGPFLCIGGWYAMVWGNRLF